MVIALLTFNVQAQVKIGENPTVIDPSAILEIESTDKGVLLPRVSLSSATMQLGSVANATGLLIFNSGGSLSQGYYFWNGSEWRSIETNTAIPPQLSNVICGAASLTPGVYTSGQSYTGVMTIPYTGGNGGSFSTGATTTVNGLNVSLRSDKLKNGSGELYFDITGTPTVSSPTATNITVDNGLIPFYSGSCTAKVGDVSNANIQTAATMGPLFATSDPAAGYHRFVTSPDGKFSVRVIINQGGAFANSDLQIRSNIGTPSIMWNAGTYYINGTTHQGNNGMTFPSAGVWYGNGGGDGVTMGDGVTNAWADADVYFNSPEWRRYSWMNTDPNDKTMYVLTFMLGAPSSALIANATNCPASTCTQTKAFLKIEQVSAD